MTDIILQITSGDGPKECQWVVVQLALAFCKEAKVDKLNAAIFWEGEPQKTTPSCLLKISGPAAQLFANDRIGTIRWIGQSPFRKNHKRKNWFVGVSKAPDVEDIPELRAADIRFQTFRASGPGGQHANKTDSAVRATHTPSGITTVAQDERSQHANKRLARIRLLSLIHI